MTPVVLCAFLFASPPERPEPVRAWTIEVEGLHCDGCAAGVRHALLRWDGVRRVDCARVDDSGVAVATVLQDESAPVEREAIERVLRDYALRAARVTLIGEAGIEEGLPVLRLRGSGQTVRIARGMGAGIIENHRRFEEAARAGGSFTVTGRLGTPSESGEVVHLESFEPARP